ncbi:V-set and immunoglobulin domain-containing protein 10 [Micropterus salmoides]|uniref:V-set and immunoglobulin domain-containing protein 10 n=1 Tax=Micropterus salmoides TaxID=27706 RepID=UPI0018EA6705|nr:V-set and immunoglobulin domain-containing protein 10 [Micropterus salmoides]
MFVLKFPDQQVLGPLSVRQKSYHTGHSCVLCSLSAVVCNGRTGVHCVAVCYRHAHTGGGLVGQVWTRRLLFTLVEGDVAIWTVIMKIVTTVALLLLLCLPATVALSGNGSTVTAAPGDIALLPCYTDSNVTILTTWMKDGREVSRGGGASPRPPPAGQRVSVLPDGRLNISRVIPEDEGSYLCNSTLPGNNTFRARVMLQVASGPENVSVSISPATALPNGTLFTYRGSKVSFECSSFSYPSQQLTWAFRGASSSNESLLSTSGSRLNYSIDNIQPSAQGFYSCRANNTISHQAVNKSTELLVYYAPDRHPECMWAPTEDPTHVQFNCTWFEAYPTPTLQWEKDQDDQGARSTGHVYALGEVDNLSVTLNRSMLTDGEMLRCMAKHPTLTPGKEKLCSLILKYPFPEGEPLATALEATSITLTCSESVSVPAANTTWRKGPQQENIVPGLKYFLDKNGPVLKLTIRNISKDDEGVYFCRSENPLAVRELEVYLTVRTSSAYTGAIIGVLIAALVVGSGAVLAKTVYSRRHRICLGSGFGQLDEDRGDVLSLVESDDEQIFQDAVPQLPPLTNGNHTTLVQIHRMPSSDHEDADTADTSPQQQEETVQSGETVDLVTF